MFADAPPLVSTPPPAAGSYPTISMSHPHTCVVAPRRHKYKCIRDVTRAAGVAGGPRSTCSSIAASTGAACAVGTNVNAHTHKQTQHNEVALLFARTHSRTGHAAAHRFSPAARNAPAAAWKQRRC